jgi:SanA protein
VLIVVGVCLLLVAAANLYVIRSARAAIVADPASAPVRPYAIVLGSRVFPDGSPSIELAARLQAALVLYRAGRAGKLIMSGRTDGSYDEPHAMAAWLASRGVPSADLVIDAGGHRTAATMADAAALGVRSALVVSQAYHLPRALYLARHAGIEALGVPAPTRHRNWFVSLRVFCREAAARAETMLEVALGGAH